MPLKDHIATVATNLFSRNGIKRVSMDDVARKANVSKRTLYEFYNDKESLLIGVLDNLREPFTDYFDLLGKNENTALEVILQFNEKLMEKPVWLCDDFFEDIKRYPKAIEALMDTKNKFLIKMIELLKRGEKEAVFMSDVNYDIISLLAQHQLSKSEPSSIFTKYTHEEIHNTVVFIFLRGICTDSGREILEKYTLKKKYKNEFANRDL